VFNIPQIPAVSQCSLHSAIRSPSAASIASSAIFGDAAKTPLVPFGGPQAPGTCCSFPAKKHGFNPQGNRDLI